jgi:hypothetical protein
LGQTDIIGHGATIDRGGLMTFRDMLRRIKERMLLIEQQLSVFEIFAALGGMFCSPEA